MIHSYIIQPTVSADGQLLSPLFIVLKEASWKLGPRVQQTLLKAPNIIIRASVSGKLTKGHLEMWFEQIYLPYTSENSVLLLDS